MIEPAGYTAGLPAPAGPTDDGAAAEEAAARLGLALGSGTDVAIVAADMILLRDDLGAVPDAIALARATFRTIRRNLVWGFCYNVLAIPLAALGFLDPLVAAATRTLSSVFVVWNSLRLRRFANSAVLTTPVLDSAVLPTPAFQVWYCPISQLGLEADGLANECCSRGGAEITVPVQRRDASPNRRPAAADERHRALFELMPPGVVYCAADGSVLGVNPAARRILGLPDADVTGWPLSAARWMVHEDGTPFRPEQLPVRRALSTGQLVSDVLMGVLHGQTGELRWVLATAIPDARDGQGRPQRVYLLFTDVTEQRKVEAAQERAELLARERAALAEARNAGERLTFLMRAGALVAAVGDRDELLDQVTQLVVPSLADYCVVFLPTADGKLRASAFTHADPLQAGKLAAIRKHPVPTAGPLMSQISYTTGTTLLVRDVPAELPTWAAADPGLTEIVASVHPESAVATPLLVGQRPLGVMLMARGTGRPRFASADAEVVEEIARRLAVGLANADTFAREHAIAETLQRSILPESLPRIAGLDLAVRYLPGTAGTDVGGDWYDAFGVQGGGIALVTGDVAGHSIASASVMGQVRSMLRAYAIDDPHPGSVLRRTNAAVARLLPETLVSAIYMVLDLSTGDLSYANAGHPPPAVVAGGQAEYLGDTTGIMLGACADAAFGTGLRRLSPGTGLLCYTDGLIEGRHRDITEGLALLAGTLRFAAPFSAEHMCATVEASLLSAAHRADDVCLLAAKLTS